MTEDAGQSAGGAAHDEAEEPYGEAEEPHGEAEEAHGDAGEHGEAAGEHGDTGAHVDGGDQADAVKHTDAGGNIDLKGVPEDGLAKALGVEANAEEIPEDVLDRLTPEQRAEILASIEIEEDEA
jgi:hypothetical protein